MFFLDTSAILTLFLQQPGFEAVASLIRRCQRRKGFLAACDLALTEATISLHRFVLSEKLPAEDRDHILGELGTWMETGVEMLNLTAVDQLSACTLAMSQKLRTLDALHLAVAMRARRQFGATEATFVTLDQEQEAVARAIGFNVASIRSSGIPSGRSPG